MKKGFQCSLSLAYLLVVDMSLQYENVSSGNGKDLLLLKYKITLFQSILKDNFLETGSPDTIEEEELHNTAAGYILFFFNILFLISCLVGLAYIIRRKWERTQWERTQQPTTQVYSSGTSSMDGDKFELEEIQPEMLQSTQNK